MKRLSLLRHGKSSWKDLSIPDSDRALNKRGKRDAPRMGARFARHYDVGDCLVITSPAKRALATARLFAEAAGYPPEKIAVDDRLYLAEVDDIARVVQEQDSAVAHLVVIGHNPGFTDFVNRATRHFIENLPTCGLAVLRYDIDGWADVTREPATLAEFDYPKKQHI